MLFRSGGGKRSAGCGGRGKCAGYGGGGGWRCAGSGGGCAGYGGGGRGE